MKHKKVIILLQYFLNCFLMWVNISGHILMLLEAYGIIKLHYGEWAQGWYLLYSPIWIVCSLYILLFGRITHSIVPFPQKFIIVLLVIPICMSLYREVMILLDKPFGLPLSVSCVYAILQGLLLIRYSYMLFHTIVIDWKQNCHTLS